MWQLVMNLLQTPVNKRKTEVFMRRDSAVRKVNGYRLDYRGSIPGRGKNFSFSTASKPASMKWVLGILFQG
jgi:hypothetical protein